jgi:hypothetical protein
VVYGSNFADEVTVNWNGTALPTTCVDANLIPSNCPVAAALTATVPASDFAAQGAAQVTISNLSMGIGSPGGTSNALAFNIGQPPAGNTWVRTVSGISAPNDVVWDAARSKLYVSVSSADIAHPNTIAVIDPVAGNATSFVPAGNNPHLLSISSDGSYLWVELDGSSSVERFLLPGLSQDISFSLPADGSGNPQQAVALQAAPVSAHTVGLVAGNWSYSPPGNGVYVFDDSTQRPNYVPGLDSAGGAAINWIQWGADDTIIYGEMTPLNVSASGVALANSGNGVIFQPTVTQYDPSNGLLYSYGSVYDPVKQSLMGTFDLPETGSDACTADSSAGRYDCVTVPAGSDVDEWELLTFDLNSYAQLSQVNFGYSAGSPLSPITGAPSQLVRWGNAGLALLTSTWPYYGNGGVFLIDGASVNPTLAPDTTSGSAFSPYATLNSLNPASATAASGDVQVTIKGTGFTADSTACWNCNALQFRFLPTTYVSPTQLNATIPLADVSSTEPIEISVFDQSSYSLSLNALTFTVLSSSGTTQVTAVNLCGLSMAWDSNSQLLYVGTADYDSSYPNSIVAINPTTAAVVRLQTVEPDPIFLSESASGNYIYAAYESSTNLTQVALPGLNTTLTVPLRDPNGTAWVPGDLKAAPQDPNVVAVTLIIPGWHPEALGGVTIFDNGTPLPDALPGWLEDQNISERYDTLAWSASDQLLTAAPSGWDDGNFGPLYLAQVNATGAIYQGQGTAVFNTAGGYIHSDFGTDLIYSDGGVVADPNTGAIVGTYGASGLAAPDSSLNRVFILGQTSAQANTDNYTIESFDQKAFAPVSSITLSNVSGTPIGLSRWGNTGLAVLTSGGIPNVVSGQGMLYMVEDANFVSSAPAAASARTAAMEPVRRRWKWMTTREIVEQTRRAAYGRPGCCRVAGTP